MDDTKSQDESVVPFQSTLAIIAMKGHPCAGKTKYANLIASLLECPIISSDDICSCISSLEQFLKSSPEAVAERLEDLSFEAACRAAHTHLRQNFGVIIDSPLSCEARLRRLQELSKAVDVPLLVVEVKASDEYEWKSWIEGRAASGTASATAAPYPYKPSTWEEIEQILEFNKGITDYEMKDVRTLVIHNNSATYINSVLMGLAIQELVFSPSVRKEELPSWIPEEYKHFMDGEFVGPEFESQIEEVEQIYTRLLFFTFSFDWRKEGESALICGKCQKPVSGKIYCCNEFNVLLHKSCAESPQPQNLVIFPGDDIPYLEGNGPEFSLKEFPSSKYSDSCAHRVPGRKFCDECLFKSHLRSGLLPTVIHHEGHRHPMMLRLEWNETNPEPCDACGDEVKNIWYFCDKCTFHCHVKCLLSPISVKNKYHVHQLTRKCFPEDDDSGEQVCDACQKYGDPKYWIYKCDECNGFACHLNCPTLSEPDS